MICLLSIIGHHENWDDADEKNIIPKNIETSNHKFNNQSRDFVVTTNNLLTVKGKKSILTRDHCVRYVRVKLGS